MGKRPTTESNNNNNEESEESIKKAKIEQDEATAMLGGASNAVGLPQALPAVAARIGAFKDISEVLLSDVVMDNIVNLSPLFKAAGWEQRIKPGVQERALAVIRDTIGATPVVPYTHIAKMLMWYQNPLLLGLEQQFIYALYVEVLFAMKSVFTCVDDPHIYYRLYCTLTEMFRDTKAASQPVTMRVKKHARMPEPKQVAVYKQNLKCHKGVEYTVKDKGMRDYTKTKLGPSVSQESLNERQAWNWIVRDMQIENYYEVNEKKANEYLALPADQKVQYAKPSMFAPRVYFAPYNFDFEELRHLRNIDVLVFTGEPSTPVFDAKCTFPKTDEGEMNLVRKFYYRKLTMAPIKKKDQTTPEPLTHLVVPKIPVESLPTLPRKPTEADVTKLQAVQDANAKAYDEMRVLFIPEFWNNGKKLVIPPTHYAPSEDIKFGAPIDNSAPNPGSRARADAEEEGYFAKLIWKEGDTPEEVATNKKAAMDEFNAVFDKAKNKANKEVKVIEFDCPVIDIKRQDEVTKARAEAGLPKNNYVFMKPAFLHNKLLTVKTVPSIGDQSSETDGTKFNNKPFDNCIYVVGSFVSERGSDEEQQEANEMA